VLELGHWLVWLRLLVSFQSFVLRLSLMLPADLPSRALSVPVSGAEATDGGDARRGTAAKYGVEPGDL